MSDSNKSHFSNSRDRNSLSSYYNIDPALLQNSSPQFLIPDSNTSKHARFDMAFGQIGGAIMTGSVFGGCRGFLEGINKTKTLKYTIKRTQMLNHVAKGGAAMAQTLGVVSLLYSAFGVIIAKARGNDDELNTIAAASLTGIVFKSSSGMKTCLKGGLAGLLLSSVLCVYSSRDRLKQLIH